MPPPTSYLQNTSLLTMLSNAVDPPLCNTPLYLHVNFITYGYFGNLLYKFDAIGGVVNFFFF